MNNIFTLARSLASTPVVHQETLYDLWQPRMFYEVKEDSDSRSLVFNVAGVKKEDIRVELKQGQLSISSKSKKGEWTVNEVVESSIDAEKISAKLSDGELTVILPFNAASRKRVIAIE